MEDWKVRVVEEMNDVEKRLDALKKFFKEDVYKGLEEIEKKLLQLQLFHMKGYLNALTERVTRYISNK